MLLESGRNRAGVEGICSNAVGGRMASDANCQQRICGLGLTIRTEWRVGDEIEVEIIKYYRREEVAAPVSRRARLGRPRVRSASIPSARSVPRSWCQIAVRSLEAFLAGLALP